MSKTVIRIGTANGVVPRKDLRAPAVRDGQRGPRRTFTADDVLAAIDQRADRVGLSRTAYLRRALARAAAVLHTPVTAEHLRLFADRFADWASRCGVSWTGARAVVVPVRSRRARPQSRP